MRFKWILFLIALTLIFIPSVMAVSIGVSPGRATFNEILPGGYSEQTVTISTNSEQIVTAHYEVSGELAPWIRFEPNVSTFSFSSVQPYPLRIIVEPPLDARTDSYDGKISFVTDHFGGPSGRAGGMVRAAVSMGLSVAVTNEEVNKCRAGSFYVEDTEIGLPIRFGGTIINDGNVRLKPKISIDIWDQSRETILVSEEAEGSEILPTMQGKMQASIPNNLPVGQYWATVSSDECDNSQFFTFSVVEKGGIADHGVLREIRTKLWAIVGEPVVISAVFSNSGLRTVLARFNGNIMLDNSIIEVIESDELEVAPGETINFDTIYTPVQSGRHVITGRVIYNKKMTFEKSSIMNVNPSEESTSDLKFGTIILLAAYLAIIVTILFLVRKILKERKKRRKF